jgi:hypothetical protein
LGAASQTTEKIQLEPSPACAPDSFSALDSSQLRLGSQSDRIEEDANLEKLLILIFLKLKAKHGVTEEVLQIFFEEIKNVVSTFSTQISLLIDTLTSVYPNLKDDFRPRLVGLESKFKFDRLSSAYKRKKAFQKQCGYVEPITVALGRNDEHVDCEYQYVPIGKSLASLLSDKEVFEKIKEKKKTENNILQDYNDGLLYQSTNKRSDNDLVLELVIFSDAFGLANVLSDKSSKYKMNGFYYSIGNFNPILRSQIDNIQLISLCREKYIKLFGWNAFVGHMVAELKSLETNGLKIGNENITVSATLISIAGDNLGSHGLGGFCENFSTVEFFCRFCLYTIAQLKAKYSELAERRTPDSYATHLEEKRNTDLQNKGIKFDSVFNTLQTFHVCNPGLPPCLGHDMFHGAFARDLQLIIKKLVSSGILKISFVNAMLQKFVKLFRNFASFPKVNIQNKKLKGSMSEIYKMIIVFPYIMLHAIVDDEHQNLLELLLTMVRITKFVTAPAISNDQIILLEDEISSYFELRLAVFPNESLLPKHHFIQHYPELIRLFGPLTKFWTMPFEHKHQYFKNMIGHAKNFKNESKLLAERHQLYQASLTNDRFPADIVTNSAKIYDQKMFGVPLVEDVKFYAKSVKFNHQLFSQDDYIVFDQNRDTSSLQVMKIKCILLTTDYNKLFFLGPTTEVFENRENELYESLSDFSKKYITVRGDQLQIFKPINGYTVKNTLYLSLPFTFPIVYFQN